MFWNSIPDAERLHLWKKLRDDLKDESEETVLQEIAKFCAPMPFGARSIDYYSPDDWPTPWEILYHGDLCTSSISLLMFYTLDLLGYADIALHLVEDEDGIYLLPVVENQYVLNYALGQVSMYPSIKENLTVLKIFDKSQIKTIT
jgi:hypothetical protein